MCLTKINEHYDNPSTLIVSGWKSFQRGATHRFQNQTLHSKLEVPLDKWIEAEPKLIKADDRKEYYTGFHVWEDEAGSYPSREKRTRVYIRKITCKGIQDNEKVLIAQEMYVPSDPDAWPPKPGEPTKKDTLLEKVKNSVKGGNA